MNNFGTLPGLPVRELVLVSAIAAATTFFTTGPVRLAAQTYLRPTKVRERDVHKAPVPRLGGIAILTGLLTALLVASKLPALTTGLENSSYVSNYFVAAAALIVIIGAIDDAIGLSSLSKLIGQITAGSILASGGFSWSTITIPSFNGQNPTVIILDSLQGGIVAISVVVIFINSINFVDGLDGLAGGICAISALTLGAFSLISISNSGGLVTYYGPVIVSSAILGAAIGFLPHNFYPARVFMGDSGSMLLGLSLAAVSIGLSGQATPAASSSRAAITLLTPIIIVASVMLLPILDLVLAVLRRTRSGSSIFEADKEHIHHRMLKVGHSHRKSTLILWYWSAAIAITALGATVLNLNIAAIGAFIAVALSASAITFFPKLGK